MAVPLSGHNTIAELRVNSWFVRLSYKCFWAKFTSPVTAFYKGESQGKKLPGDWKDVLRSLAPAELHQTFRIDCESTFSLSVSHRRRKFHHRIGWPAVATHVKTIRHAFVEPIVNPH
jgi:hypothetical protein